ATESDLELLLAHDCWLIVTLSILFHPDGIERGDGARPDILRGLQQARGHVHESVRRIFASGLRIALGTDSMHGCMAYEFGLAVELGLPPADALRAATGRAAEALCIADRTGTIEAGKAADIIALDGNPLVDPSALERVVFVMKGGRQYGSSTG
ncbi:MAG: amidohydrolase family protein, partial [Chloroflexi bacterium]|nr:amidohydrolase family protein [Chloroflexota bacterium]